MRKLRNSSTVRDLHSFVTHNTGTPFCTLQVHIIEVFSLVYFPSMLIKLSVFCRLKTGSAVADLARYRAFRPILFYDWRSSSTFQPKVLRFTVIRYFLSVSFVSPVFLYFQKPTCGSNFSPDTNHKKYKHGVLPADLSKWQNKNHGLQQPIVRPLATQTPKKSWARRALANAILSFIIYCCDIILIKNYKLEHDSILHQSEMIVKCKNSSGYRTKGVVKKKNIDDMS